MNGVDKWEEHSDSLTLLRRVQAVYQGASVVVMMRFELQPFLELIQKYKVTRMNLVPPILIALAKHPLVSHCKPLCGCLSVF